MFLVNHICSFVKDPGYLGPEIVIDSSEIDVVVFAQVADGLVAGKVENAGVC